MKQENKELLLIDLCARLPYHVMVEYRGANVDLTRYARSIKIENCKPYLRPMSSMTEEEANEFETISEDLFTNEAPEQIWGEVIDWLNKNMFDYRDLIPMNLALEAPEGMYK